VTWPARLIATALVLAALAVLGLTGGLRPAPAPPTGPPTVPVATIVDSGPWTAAVTGATAVARLGTFVPQAGAWLLAVDIRVLVGGPDGRSSADLDRVAELPDQAGLTGPTPRWVALRRDTSELAELNPGMPELVAYLFEVDGATAVPATVTVELSGYVTRYSFETHAPMWTDFGPRARVTVPVKDAR
jgi:hypothetical protein